MYDFSKIIFLRGSCLCILSALSTSTFANNTESSSSLYGPLDLNTIPSARMDQTGTMRAGISTLDPYINGWFTGDDVGIFAGAEYFTPLKGLSVKLDYGADRYSAEKAAFDFNAPAPWSAGLNYKPADWVDIGIAAQGTDKLMGRLSLQSPIQNWRDESTQDKMKKQSPFRTYRTGLALPSEMELSAAGEYILLYNAATETNAAHAGLTLQNFGTTPHQIGQAAKHMANHAGPSIESLSITPTRLGLYGPTIKLMRSSLENANAKDAGSTEEIWNKAELIPASRKALKKHRSTFEYGYGLRDFNLRLETQASLSEEDNGALYRTSVIAGSQAQQLFGWLDNFYSFRLNLSGNLDRLEDLRPRSLLPVRSNVDDFAERRLATESAFSAFTHSFNENTHMSLMNGYLEEMYAGLGGEVLYRPYKARWAIGAESFLAFKRDPDTSLNLGLNGDSLLTGHIQGWYDIPHLDLTMNAQIGRYLAEDIGGTIALEKHFHNGAKTEGYVTVTDQSDVDIFGGTTNADHGIRLSLPLGGFKYAPRNTKADFKFAPFGRDIGQKLDNPLALYELTESFSTRHLAEYWNDIIQ